MIREFTNLHLLLVKCFAASNLRARFAEQFGTNISAILRTNQLVAATNQPARGASSGSASRSKPSLYQRTLAVVGLGSHARKTSAEKHLTKADRLALDQMTPELMETLVAARIAVADDDYNALMTARARWVQDWLLLNGQVSSERLLLVAPKPVDAAYQGQSRANLSLD